MSKDDCTEDKPSMSMCVNRADYEKKVIEWQESKIEAQAKRIEYLEDELEQVKSELGSAECDIIALDGDLQMLREVIRVEESSVIDNKLRPISDKIRLGIDATDDVKELIYERLGLIL